MTDETERPITSTPLASLRAAAFWPLRLVMNLIDRPLTWLQATFGQRAMIVFFLLPNMAIFGIFVMLPLVINVIYSFTGGSALFLDDRVGVGFEQYQTLFDCRDFTDPFSCRQDAFWAGVYNTLTFMLLQVPAVALTALVTALVLNREMRGRGFWRAIFFFPVLLSPVVVGLIWKWILERNGLLNALLNGLGLEGTVWLGDSFWAMFWAIFVSTWAHMGFYTLILLAGLQSIPRDLYEAADMDGTSRPRALLRITLPLLWPTMLVVLILALIRAVQIFDEVYVLTGGGPGTSTQMLVQYIYQTGFAALLRNLGLAAAASILMGLVLMVLTLLQLGIAARRSREVAG
ncbi:MAG: sugar ABC transporter permease [Azospirillaceae bacterium]